MRNIVRPVIAILLLSIASTAFAQFGDLLRKAREQIKEARETVQETHELVEETPSEIQGLGNDLQALAGVQTPGQHAAAMAAECEALASTDSAFATCQSTCSTVAQNLSADGVPAQTADAFLNLCATEHATAFESQQGVVPEAAMASAAQGNQAAPATAVTEPGAGGAATTADLPARTAEMLRLAASCETFAPNPSLGLREMCMRDCERAAQVISASYGINAAGHASTMNVCHGLHEHAARADQSRASGDYLSHLQSLRDECAALGDVGGQCARSCGRIESSFAQIQTGNSEVKIKRVMTCQGVHWQAKFAAQQWAWEAEDRQAVEAAASEAVASGRIATLTAECRGLSSNEGSACVSICERILPTHAAGGTVPSSSVAQCESGHRRATQSTF